MRPLNVGFSIPWDTNDAWSESYVGVWRLIHEILPSSINEQTLEDGALCQLGLIGAQHLLEVALGSLLEPFVTERGVLTPKIFKDEGYFNLLSHHTKRVTGKAIDLNAEPFCSTEDLRQRRNGTAHKSSDIVTVNMARSALFTAVAGTRALYAHFEKEFPYEQLLRRYPLEDEPPFSTFTASP